MIPLLLTTEKAFALLAADAVTSSSITYDVNIYTGIDNDEKEGPAVIVYATEAKQDFENGGVWHVPVNVIVKETASQTTGSMVGELANVIYQRICSSNVETTLSTITTNYFVYGLFLEDLSNQVIEDAWSQTYTFDCVCTTKT